MNEIILHGIGASAGVVVAPAFIYHPLELTITERTPDDPSAEMARFTDARAQAREELNALQEQTTERVDAEHAAIFGAHVLLVDDPALVDLVKGAVDAGQTVENALNAAVAQIAELFRSSGDELLAARADDIEDVGRRLLRILLGLPDASLAAIRHPCIVVTGELTPSDTAVLDPSAVLGLVVARGGITAHAAIIARTLGIPAVVALGDDAIARIPPDTLLAMNGQSGTVIVNPGEATRAEFEHQRQRWLARAERIAASAGIITHTADGVRVEVGANIGDLASAQEAVERGAEGVGLLRTEFLYLGRAEPPTEAEQIALYRDIFAALGTQRPIVVRTLDVGGDKPPSFMPFPEEANPFLGYRGARLYPDYADLFRTQIRALLQASVGYDVRIMYPMIDVVEALQNVGELTAQACAELDRAGVEYARDVPFGIMVETPSAALTIDLMAQHADFFSIGSNDLTQYTLAADRDNARVARFFQPLSPALLRLVKRAIEDAHRANRQIGMCGELAGLPLAIPILLGLGLDKFSMVPGAIAEAKWIISQLTMDDAKAIAHAALQLPTAGAIEDYMQKVLADRGLAG